MGDSFSTNGTITIQPGSAAVPYTFTFKAATSATANDGSIPFASTIASVEVKAYDSSGNDVTSEMVASSSTTTLVVTVSLSYPPTTGAGNYSIEIVKTLNTGAEMEADFTRVYAGDITA